MNDYILKLTSEEYQQYKRDIESLLKDKENIYIIRNYLDNYLLLYLSLETYNKVKEFCDSKNLVISKDEMVLTTD